MIAEMFIHIFRVEIRRPNLNNPPGAALRQGFLQFLPEANAEKCLVKLGMLEMTGVSGVQYEPTIRSWLI